MNTVGLIHGGGGALQAKSRRNLEQRRNLEETVADIYELISSQFS